MKYIYWFDCRNIFLVLIFLFYLCFQAKPRFAILLLSPSQMSTRRVVRNNVVTTPNRSDQQNARGFSQSHGSNSDTGDYRRGDFGSADKRSTYGGDEDFNNSGFQKPRYNSDGGRGKRNEYGTSRGRDYFRGNGRGRYNKQDGRGDRGIRSADRMTFGNGQSDAKSSGTTSPTFQVPSFEDSLRRVGKLNDDRKNSESEVGSESGALPTSLPLSAESAEHRESTAQLMQTSSELSHSTPARPSNSPQGLPKESGESQMSCTTHGDSVTRAENKFASRLPESNCRESTVEAENILPNPSQMGTREGNLGASNDVLMRDVSGDDQFNSTSKFSGNFGDEDYPVIYDDESDDGRDRNLDKLSSNGAIVENVTTSVDVSDAQVLRQTPKPPQSRKSLEGEVMMQFDTDDDTEHSHKNSPIVHGSRAEGGRRTRELSGLRNPLYDTRESPGHRSGRDRQSEHTLRHSKHEHNEASSRDQARQDADSKRYDQRPVSHSQMRANREMQRDVSHDGQRDTRRTSNNGHQENAKQSGDDRRFSSDVSARAGSRARTVDEFQRRSEVDENTRRDSNRDIEMVSLAAKPKQFEDAETRSPAVGKAANSPSRVEKRSNAEVASDTTSVAVRSTQSLQKVHPERAALAGFDSDRFESPRPNLRISTDAKGERVVNAKEDHSKQTYSSKRSAPEEPANERTKRRHLEDSIVVDKIPVQPKAPELNVDNGIISARNYATDVARLCYSTSPLSSAIKILRSKLTEAPWKGTGGVSYEGKEEISSFRKSCRRVIVEATYRNDLDAMQEAFSMLLDTGKLVADSMKPGNLPQFSVRADFLPMLRGYVQLASGEKVRQLLQKLRDDRQSLSPEDYYGLWMMKPHAREIADALHGAIHYDIVSAAVKAFGTDDQSAPFTANLWESWLQPKSRELIERVGQEMIHARQFAEVFALFKLCMYPENAPDYPSASEFKNNITQQHSALKSQNSEVNTFEPLRWSRRTVDELLRSLMREKEYARAYDVVFAVFDKGMGIPSNHLNDELVLELFSETASGPSDGLSPAIVLKMYEGIRDKLKPSFRDASFFENMLYAYSSSGDVEGTLRVIRDLRVSGYRLKDHSAFNPVLTLSVRYGKLRQFVEVLCQLVIPEGCDQPLDQTFLSGLIRHCVDAGLFDHAFWFLTYMRAKAIPRTTAIYRNLFVGLRKIFERCSLPTPDILRNAEGVRVLYLDAVRNGYRPTSEETTSVLEALFQSANRDAIYEFLEDVVGIVSSSGAGTPIVGQREIDVWMRTFPPRILMEALFDTSHYDLALMVYQRAMLTASSQLQVFAERISKLSEREMLSSPQTFEGWHVGQFLSAAFHLNYFDVASRFIHDLRRITNPGHLLKPSREFVLNTLVQLEESNDDRRVSAGLELFLLGCDSEVVGQTRPVQVRAGNIFLKDSWSPLSISFTFLRSIESVIRDFGLPNDGGTSSVWPSRWRVLCPRMVRLKNGRTSRKVESEVAFILHNAFEPALPEPATRSLQTESDGPIVEIDGDIVKQWIRDAFGRHENSKIDVFSCLTGLNVASAGKEGSMLPRSSIKSPTGEVYATDLRTSDTLQLARDENNSRAPPPNDSFQHHRGVYLDRRRSAGVGDSRGRNFVSPSQPSTERRSRDEQVAYDGRMQGRGTEEQTRTVTSFNAGSTNFKQRGRQDASDDFRSRDDQDRVPRIRRDTDVHGEKASFSRGVRNPIIFRYSTISRILFKDGSFQRDHSRRRNI
ncbi:hypothetical protein BJ742DRAFT_822128 [Cladochytrium replicatum]|nr:hypothetical protein BJ742DRAFT_822128 [Cladochytrium replicatum]